MSRVLRYQVADAEKGLRLGSFLRRRGYAQGLLAALRQSDGVRVNGRLRYMRDQVYGGDIIQVCLPEDRPSLQANPGLQVSVLYEDEDILLVDKPAGMLTHPAGEGFDDALGNFFTAHCPGLSFRPIGRLDRNTTGVCLLAKNRFAAGMLSGKTEKIYYAVAEGVIGSESGIIDRPLIAEPGGSNKRLVDPLGKPSLTLYQVLKRLPDYTFLRLQPVTGRTHQLRAHLSWLGYPLAGDVLYGGSSTCINRQALHCGCLRFAHPVDGRQMVINAPLPPDICTLLGL